MPTAGTEGPIKLTPKPFGIVGKELQESVDRFITWDWSNDPKGLVLAPPEKPKRWLNVVLQLGPMAVVMSLDMADPSMTVGKAKVQVAQPAGQR